MTEYYENYSNEDLNEENSSFGAYEGGCGCDADCTCPICNGKQSGDRTGLYVFVAVIIVMLLLIVWYRTVGKETEEGPLTYLYNKVYNLIHGL